MTRLGLAIALIAATPLAACVNTTSVLCDDGISRCPSTTTCLALPDRTVCVTDPQAAACDGIGEGMECTLDSVPGTCKSGACFPSRCGDGFIDTGETCDDGNKESLDGCSADCQSLEVCGNSITDLARGEQCDDGLVGLSGDGCSSRCLNEYFVWRDVTPRIPIQRYDQVFVADPAGGVLMFGGTAGDGAPGDAPFPLDDTWRWDGVIWSELTPPSGAPGRRARMAAALDVTHQQTLIFGGRDLGGTFLDELWAWNGMAWTQLTPSGAAPDRRAGASMACSTTRCVLFGGENSSGLLGDTWSWDGASWTQITGPAPSARAGAGLAFDTARNRFVLIGGGNAQDQYELSGSQWVALGPIGAFAAANLTVAYDPVALAIVVINGSMTYTYNGTWTNTGRQFLSTNPKLSYSTAQGRAIGLSSTQNTVAEWTFGNWSIRANQRPLGNPRGLTATYDPLRGRTIVIDAGVTGNPTGTWEWDGRLWHRTAELTALNHPPAAEGTALVFDTKCGEAVAFGGALSNTMLHGETWRYLATGTWTRAPGAGPSPRSQHAMAYDANRDAIVLFGGRTGTSATAISNELWEWSGTCGAKTWTRMMVAGPSARAGARMAYDASRQVVVMFGGAGADTGTWKWDGIAWKEEVATATSPSSRSEHGMVYDARLRQVVLYGGRVGGLRLGDGARWDGSAWTPIEEVVPIVGRSTMAMAPDVTGGLLLIGGETSLASVPEILRLRAETELEPFEACQLATADADGDGLAGCADPDCGFRCRPLCPLGEDCSGPHCGDGVCSVVEDDLICPADCP